MTAMTSFLTGLAEMLNDAGIGVWNPTGVYTADQVGITLSAVPQEPDQLIVLTARPISDDPVLNDSITAVQIRHRGLPNNPRGVLDRDDAVFDLIQGIHDTEIGGLPIVVAWRQGGGPLGQDQNLRWEHASTFYLRTAIPTTYRTD